MGAGPAVVSADGQSVLPTPVAQELLRRWAEPHRHYHSITHLAAGLDALGLLGGQRLELVAYWFHDAVHSNTTPADEMASAALVARLMTDHLDADEIAEVQRLVMLTAGHHTRPDDPAGQRLCDADLSGLGADEETYRRNVAGIRAEMPHLSDAQWQAGRSQFLTRFLERDHFFATAAARNWWELRARENLRSELSELAGIPPQ